MTIAEHINQLKKDKNAIILAHTYTYPEVQDIADYVGDSYGLSKKAASVEDADMIVFAGVRFMAETAAILAPDKKVILPVSGAGCPMADMINEFQLRKFKAEYPEAAVVCYVNSTVQTKALSTVCVTSSNAVKIVRQLEEKQILFVPDQHLGSFVAEQIPEKEVVLWKGYCPVHEKVNPEDVRAAKERYPDAAVMMHPECRKDARAEADYILSTGQMIDEVKSGRHESYIVVTEMGIAHTLQKHAPGVTLYELTDVSMRCANMKKISLEDIARSLEEESDHVVVSPSIAEAARNSLELMLKLSEN